MDFACIETWLALPEFRVTGQVMRSHNLELHLERRDTYLVCPRCQGSCARIKEGRQRCLRDLPILDRGHLAAAPETVSVRGLPPSALGAK